MLVHIAIEIVLAMGTAVVSSLIWELRRRAMFLCDVMSNRSLLEAFFILWREKFHNPPPAIAIFSQKNEIGYYINIKCVVDADRRSQRRVWIISSVILSWMFVGSYFLGIPYLVINIIVFFLAGLGSISPSAKNNAFQHVFALAVILYKWHR